MEIQPSPSPTLSQSRVALREEEECQQLSRDLVSQLSPSDRLLTILAPEPKKVTDYVSGLFRLDIRTQRPSSRLALSPQPSDSPPASPSNEELVTRLGRKLAVLRDEQLVLREETELNETLGAALQERLCGADRPTEAAKLAHHVEEVGKVTSLLLKQLAEATQLKSSIDRRSASVSALLNKALDAEAAADFEHFVHMKASLQVESRELVDRVRLGEEQLAALRETLHS
ncbi:hypothetical protein B566_EDAN014941 [Ephemera danica]|nr:hypothetical protein B566_EDAN014941 [Ephemera danica]